ncbi:MAG: hypothetical protein MUF01_13365 [Bryobacterales bacterium]|jgi:hypothetical protein|nr:hypothetical protein [Bryobacterales bacterium]
MQPQTLIGHEMAGKILTPLRPAFALPGLRCLAATAHLLPSKAPRFPPRLTGRPA